MASRLLSSSSRRQWFVIALSDMSLVKFEPLTNFFPSWSVTSAWVLFLGHNRLRVVMLRRKNLWQLIGFSQWNGFEHFEFIFKLETLPYIRFLERRARTLDSRGITFVLREGFCETSQGGRLQRRRDLTMPGRLFSYHPMQVSENDILWMFEHAVEDRNMREQWGNTRCLVQGIASCKIIVLCQTLSRTRKYECPAMDFVMSMTCKAPYAVNDARLSMKLVLLLQVWTWISRVCQWRATHASGRHGWTPSYGAPYPSHSWNSFSPTCLCRFFSNCAQSARTGTTSFTHTPSWRRKLTPLSSAPRMF